MKEKLIIRNFGPIKDIELDLGRFNILIGEQATGKSTVAKVLAVCRYFSYLIGGDKDDVFDQPFDDGLVAWGLKESIKEGTFIYYKCKHYSLSVRSTLGENDVAIIQDETFEEFKVHTFSSELIPISAEFKNLLVELDKVRPKSKKDSDGRLYSSNIPTSFYLNDVKKVMDNPFYLPTERGLQSIFSLGQGSIPNLANFLFNYYSKIDGVYKYFKNETEIEPLGIFYVNINGVSYIRNKNEKKLYLLANAASGYQSIIPIILVIKYQNEIRKKKKTFIIEEPELNLFPNAQNQVMQYLVEKTMSNDNMVLLTTHSPYILTSVNNMIYAHQAAIIDKIKTSAIIEEKFWLNPNDVSAYLLRYNETAGGVIQENIIDDEVKQIKAEKIDEISRQFNKEYDEMLDIKYPAK